MKQITYTVTLSLCPKRIWDERRLDDIKDAINSNIQNRQQIPIEWVKEYNNLIEEPK